MAKAAGGGHVALVQLFHKWGATSVYYLNGAIKMAEYFNHEVIAQLCYDLLAAKRSEAPSSHPGWVSNIRRRGSF